MKKQIFQKPENEYAKYDLDKIVAMISSKIPDALDKHEYLNIFFPSGQYILIEQKKIKISTLHKIFDNRKQTFEFQISIIKMMSATEGLKSFATTLNIEKEEE